MRRERIVVRRGGALGDVLTTTPIIRRLAQENPETEIVFQTYHPAAYAKNPHVVAVVNDEYRGPCDRLINLDMAYENNRKVHQIEASMLVAFGDFEGDKSLEYVYPAEPPALDVDWRRTVVIHPNASWENRTIPAQWWQSVVDSLVSRGMTVLATGTQMDAPISQPCIDVRGMFSLPEQASLISHASAVLCGPSGIATLAGTTDTPIVALRTITNAKYDLPYRHGMYGWNYYPIRTPLDCYGCYDDAPAATFCACKRGDNACIVSFDVRDVVETVLFATRKDMRKCLTT